MMAYQDGHINNNNNNKNIKSGGKIIRKNT